MIIHLIIHHILLIDNLIDNGEYNSYNRMFSDRYPSYKNSEQTLTKSRGKITNKFTNETYYF